MRIFVLACCLLMGVLNGAAPGSAFMGAEEDFEILFENKLLAQVNGKPVTVFDVMKKMDLMFYRQYPQYVDSKQARFQFYQMSWKHVLQDLVEKELMMADAMNSKMEVTSSEVRQELERSFGPNIISNLDKIDMNLEEAKKILESEILIRKLTMYKITGKAYRSVSPQDIKAAYTDWAKDNASPEKWVYRVLTIRDGKDGEKGRSLASLMFKWLQDGKGDLDEAKSAFERLGILSETTKITASEELRMTQDELLPEVKEVLLALNGSGFSEPIAQKSRRDSSTSWKIYSLEKVEIPLTPSYRQMESKLRDQLLQEAVSKEGQEYLNQLKVQFDVHDAYASQLPENWEPFNLIELKKRY
jgi:hypothetical protein